jgi:hypothetical protein
MAGLLEQQMPQGAPQQPQGPQQGAPQQGQEENRPASPAEQKQFELVIKQALQFLGQKENVAAFMDMVKKTSPEQAIAVFVKRTLDGIYSAAGEAGAQLQAHTMNAAAEIVSKILIQMMASAGLPVDNPDALVDLAMQQMEQL